MLKIGEILDANIVEIQPFGLFLEARGFRILVLITDLTNPPAVPKMSDFKVGDVLKVRIILFNDIKNIFRGAASDVRDVNA